MTLEIPVERLLLAASVALLLIGAAASWSAGNAVKRLAGFLVAELGALLALAAIGAPEGALIAGAAAALAQLCIGVALVVRLQEAYGGVDAAEIDAADDQSEPPETGA